MGIQINGQTDIVTSTTAGGKVTIPTATFPSVSNINATGISTFSGGIVVSSGSTAVPSISPSGDSNTGIFFPSPDTVAIAEGGVEALRIDSSSNIGIGTTGTGDRLTVLGRVQIQQDSGSNNRLILRGQPGSTYRWNIDNNGSSNDLRIFREDDATTAGGLVYASLSSSGNLTLNGRGSFGGSSFNTDIALYASVLGETYNASGAISNKNQYYNAGTLFGLIASNNSVNSGCLIDFNAYNSANGATDVYIGAVAGPTGNGPANFVVGRRTGTQSWVESMRVDTSGNLGLGTNSPAGQLAINSGNTPVILGMSSNFAATAIYNYTKTQYTSLSASATFDVFRFLTNTGTLLSANFAIGHFYVYAQTIGGNSFAGVYAVATNGNGTSQSILTTVTSVTRGSSPVSSVQLANDTSNGAVKLQIITNANTGGTYYAQVTFIGQVY